MSQVPVTAPRSQTGVKGLDYILQGGLPRNRLYVVEGEPGSGKTTLALQFLMTGALQGETSLYITFSETEDELRSVAQSHAWDISNLHLVDLSSLEKELASKIPTSLFHPSEMELNKMTENLLRRIEEISPTRIVFDSVSEMRLLAENPLRYRRQILALKQALATRNATVLFLDDLTGSSQDLQVQSIAHGVLRLTRLHHEYGGERRQIRILKLRGVKFISGHHDFDIELGGVQVHPRMSGSQNADDYTVNRQQLPSGITELDSLLGGGLDRGTASLLIGPAGTGKSTIGMVYALAAVAKGEKVAFFTFDETIPNLLRRCEGVGLKVEEARKKGLLLLQKIDPAELSPGSFSGLIQSRIQDDGIKIVVVDSLNGYIQAMPQESFLTLQLHELLAYLNNQGIVTILTLAQHGMIGSMQSPVDLTYLADTVILTRYFEAMGSIKKAISVVKKRTGSHESTIREFAVTSQGIKVGGALTEFEGILTGVPKYHGQGNSILNHDKT